MNAVPPAVFSICNDLRESRSDLATQPRAIFHAQSRGRQQFPPVSFGEINTRSAGWQAGPTILGWPALVVRASGRQGGNPRLPPSHHKKSSPTLHIAAIYLTHQPQDIAFLIMDEDHPRTLLELERRFGNEEACAEYLAGLRWPGGWMCPRCSAAEAWSVRRGRRLCGRCRYEMSITAGSIFQYSHLPLTIWFRAMWQVTSQKNGISALGLQRVLGLGSYKTA